MKIYHKKNFAAGLFFTLLGIGFLVLFLVKREVQPKSLVFCVFSLLLGPGMLLRSLDRKLSFQDKVDELDAQIKECVRGIDPPCLSIPGVGELSAAMILSEFGDFSKFQNPSKMLAFAGLEPGYFQSGQSEYTGHMVKHGSSRLRYALMNCCLPLISNEPVFAAYYAKKRSEGKPHRVALTHVAKKLLRVIYTLQTKNIRYDPTMIH